MLGRSEGLEVFRREKLDFMHVLRSAATRYGMQYLCKHPACRVDADIHVDVSLLDRAGVQSSVCLVATAQFYPS